MRYRTSTLFVPCRCGVEHEVTITETATPGLVTNEALQCEFLQHYPEGWTITHLRSGASVANFDGYTTLAIVRRCAKALGALGDWTTSGVELQDSVDRGAFAAVIRKYHATHTGQQAPAERFTR